MRNRNERDVVETAELCWPRQLQNEAKNRNILDPKNPQALRSRHSSREKSMEFVSSHPDQKLVPQVTTHLHCPRESLILPSVNPECWASIILILPLFFLVLGKPSVATVTHSVTVPVENYRDKDKITGETLVGLHSEKMSVGKFRKRQIDVTQ